MSTNIENAPSVDLNLLPREDLELKKFNEVLRRENILIKELSDELIAFIGANVITELLPQTRDEFELKQHENDRTLGLIILEAFNPNQLKLICDELLRQMQEQGLTNQEQYDSQAIFNPLSLLYMRIAERHIKQADNYDSSASYIDQDQNNVAYWRNQCSKVANKMILCSVSTDEWFK